MSVVSLGFLPGKATSCLETPDKFLPIHPDEIRKGKKVKKIRL